jgi:hypothetical protein
MNNNENTVAGGVDHIVEKFGRQDRRPLGLRGGAVFRRVWEES